MFTGIIEHVGTIETLSIHSDGGRITIHAPELAPAIAVSNSIAVNGCCLTVVAVEGERFSADLSGETIRRTSFEANEGALKAGARVNLEQPLTAGKEFGGHFVLGHVDGTGRVTHLRPEGENWWLGVEIPEDFARYVVPKGSITIDGISLTVARSHIAGSSHSQIAHSKSQNLVTPACQNVLVEIAVIPYTYQHTNLRDRKAGDAVNLEGDILGKYVERYLAARDAGAQGSEGASPSVLTMENLREQGF